VAPSSSDPKYTFQFSPCTQVHCGDATSTEPAVVSPTWAHGTVTKGVVYSTCKLVSICILPINFLQVCQKVISQNAWHALGRQSDMTWTISTTSPLKFDIAYKNGDDKRLLSIEQYMFKRHITIIHCSPHLSLCGHFNIGTPSSHLSTQMEHHQSVSGVRTPVSVSTYVK